MNEIESLLEELNSNPINNKLKIKIANLIKSKLQEKKGSFNYWGKLHFASALTALESNVNSNYQQSDLWLHLCLVNLEKALVPKNKRNEVYVLTRKEVDGFTFEQLWNYVNEILRRIPNN